MNDDTIIGTIVKNHSWLSLLPIKRWIRDDLVFTLRLNLLLVKTGLFQFNETFALIKLIGFISILFDLFVLRIYSLCI